MNPIWVSWSPPAGFVLFEKIKTNEKHSFDLFEKIKKTSCFTVFPAFDLFEKIKNLCFTCFDIFEKIKTKTLVIYVGFWYFWKDQKYRNSIFLKRSNHVRFCTMFLSFLKLIFFKRTNSLKPMFCYFAYGAPAPQALAPTCTDAENSICQIA